MINVCNGNTLNTHTGKVFDFADPHEDQIDIEDIAHALSNVCRWGGHCKFYSVAEHSVLAYWLAFADEPDNLDLQLAVLLHDATEAYIGDMPKPLKIMISQYNDIEYRIDHLIKEKYGSRVPQSKDAIKYYDLIMFKKEREDLFEKHPIEGVDLPDVPYYDSFDLNCWEPSRAKAEFLQAYSEVGQR